MGLQEKTTRERLRKNELKKLVLATVAFSGVLAVALVAPNVLGAMAKLGIIPTRRTGEYVGSTRNRLLRQGLLQKKDGVLRLTEKGERELRALQLREFDPKQKKRRWDHKWRILIFDIPEYRRGLRDRIRRTLEAIGFVQLQRSVWVYPHDCEDLIVLLKADMHVGKDMLYLIVDSIENDRGLREQFGLPLR